MEVKDKIQTAFRELLKRDSYLLEVNANERSITHRLAVYLEPKFPGFQTDCEYNRDEKIPKELWSFKKTIESDDGDGVSVYPDIIIHRRGTNKNHVVIEAKRLSKVTRCSSRAECICDRCKLRAYKDDLEYQHAFFVIFPGKKALNIYKGAAPEKRAKMESNYIQEV
jgi:hypothetical protein